MNRIRFRRRLKFVIGLVVAFIAGALCAVYLPDAMHRFEEPGANDLPTESQWNSLRFASLFEGYPAISEVTLIIRETPKDSRAFIDHGLKPFQSTTTDPTHLKGFEESMMDAWRYVAPLNVVVGAGGACWGYVEIRKSDGSSITCGLSTTGITVDAFHPTLRNVFYSELFARRVDEFYYRKVGEHLPQELLSGLARQPMGTFE